MCPPAGRVGLWKDVFTVSMNDKFDTVYRQKMGKSDLTFDFGVWGAPPRPLPKYCSTTFQSTHLHHDSWQVHRSTQMKSLRFKKRNGTVGLLEKDFPECNPCQVNNSSQILPSWTRENNQDLTGNHTNTLINSWSNPPSIPTSTVCSHCCVCIRVYINQVWTVVGFSGPDP